MGQSQASKNVKQRDIRAGLVERIRAGQYNYHVLGKAQFEKCWVYLGIAQIAIAPPPSPSLKRALWGTLFLDRLEQMPFELQFSLHKCPKPSWQGFRPPQNQANARLNLVNSSLKKCPKPSGQGFRPPPPLRAMPK